MTETTQYCVSKWKQDTANSPSSLHPCFVILQKYTCSFLLKAGVKSGSHYQNGLPCHFLPRQHLTLTTLRDRVRQVTHLGPVILENGVSFSPWIQLKVAILISRSIKCQTCKTLWSDVPQTSTIYDLRKESSA